MSGIIKICGLSTAETLEATLELGVEMVGFVFFAKSPRNVAPAQAAALAARVKGRAQKVALSVNASDETLADIIAHLKPDWLQLHGAETPERAREIKSRFGLRIMKVIGIAEAADISRALAYSNCADKILFETKPAKDAKLPGGNGLVFDWRLLQNSPIKGAMLAGGLDAQNVCEAIAVSGVNGVDVSSGVESAPGVKDIIKIQSFVQAARQGFKMSGVGE